MREPREVQSGGSALPVRETQWGVGYIMALKTTILASCVRRLLCAITTLYHGLRPVTAARTRGYPPSVRVHYTALNQRGY